VVWSGCGVCWSGMESKIDEYGKFKIRIGMNDCLTWIAMNVKMWFLWNMNFYDFLDFLCRGVSYMRLLFKIIGLNHFKYAC
jgi:hypothetical protein